MQTSRLGLIAFVVLAACIGTSTYFVYAEGEEMVQESQESAPVNEGAAIDEESSGQPSPISDDVDVLYTAPQEPVATTPQAEPPLSDEESTSAPTDVEVAIHTPETIPNTPHEDIVHEAVEAVAVPVEEMVDTEEQHTAPNAPWDFLSEAPIEVVETKRDGSPESPFDCIRGIFREWKIGFENPGECLAYVRERSE